MRIGTEFMSLPASEQKLRFGEYAVAKKLVTEEELKHALEIQRQSRDTIGNLAVQSGFISRQENIRMLLEQKNAGRQYGELAVEDGLLTEDQVQELLNLQKIGVKHLAKVFVEMGALSKLRAIRALIDFRSLTKSRKKAGSGRVEKLSP